MPLEMCDFSSDYSLMYSFFYEDIPCLTFIKVNTELQHKVLLANTVTTDLQDVPQGKAVLENWVI